MVIAFEILTVYFKMSFKYTQMWLAYEKSLVTLKEEPGEII